MWARTIETMLGFWLAISPFVFAHPTGEARLWWNDLLCALVVICAALVSFARSARRAHLVNTGVALWLVAVAYAWSSHPASAASQNHMVTGLLLLMLSIVPSEASRPPEAWRMPASASSPDVSR